MIVSGFRNFGWFASCVAVALGCYLWTSQVAAERGRLEAIDQSIVQAHKDIRGLETEYQTRANLAQLDRWNQDVLKLSAPRANQLLAGETEMAMLTPQGIRGAPLATASLTASQPKGSTAESRAAEPRAIAMLDRKLLDSETAPGDPDLHPSRLR